MASYAGPPGGQYSRPSAKRKSMEDDGNGSGPGEKDGESGSGGGGKGAAAAQGRAKRNRYISIACNECKRRKIKCNGQTPCQRCGNLNLECIYAPNCCSTSFKDSEEYRTMSQQISKLQDQVETLFANLNAMRTMLATSQPQIDPVLQQDSMLNDPRSAVNAQAAPDLLAPPSAARGPLRTPDAPKAPLRPTFAGPTSTQFNLGVAKDSLKSMGITPTDDGATGSNTRDVSPSHSPPSELTIHPAKDPIWLISRQEAIRLVRVYEDEMHSMYPTLRIPRLIAHINSLYTWMEAALRNGFVQTNMPGSDSIDDENTNILKLVMSTAMVLEGRGKSNLGRRMYTYVQPSVDALLLGHAGFKGVRMLALAAMYDFHCDNEARSWRVIGLTVRLCIELGLHKRETYDALPDEERQSIVLLFWAIYCLDRRWSFGTGMPFALQDSDIDPDLPKPDENSSPYLTAMIAHFAIASKVWHTMGTDTSKKQVSSEEIAYLDFQIVNWHRALPDLLRYEGLFPGAPLSSRQGSENKPLTQGQHRLQIILYLRKNAMRILIYRPVLHSVSSILYNREQAQTVVDVAKDTVRMLTMLNQTTSLYRTSQALFNAFLTSALAVLFLAVSHTPAMFAEQVREEFYMALELVRGFSKDSWVSKRLWKTIRVLKEVGPKLGLVMQPQQDQRKPSSGILESTQQQSLSSPRISHSSLSRRSQQQQLHQQQLQQQMSNTLHEDPSHSAAVAMAGLAGHNVDESAIYNNANNNNMASNASVAGPATPLWASVSTVSSGSPDVMVSDLTRLFEAAGASTAAAAAAAGIGAQQYSGFNGIDGAVGPGVNGPAAGPPGGYDMMNRSEDDARTQQQQEQGLAEFVGFGDEDELSRIMRDLF